MNIVNNFCLQDSSKPYNPPRIICPPNMAGPVKLKKGQRKVFDRLKGKGKLLLKCPTGWGKTVLLQFLAARSLLTTNRKIVIIVPQHIISTGFTKKKNLAIPGHKKPFTWFVSHNLCGNNDKKKLQELQEFLTKPINGTESDSTRILVTTHSCFALMMKEYNVPLEHFANVDLIIDECHHILAEDCEDDEQPDANSDLYANMLGIFVLRLLKTGPASAGLWCATATYGRGDGLNVLPEDYLYLFATEYVKFETYWKEILVENDLKTFKSDMVFYKKNPFEALKWVLSQKKRTLIYCPHQRSRWLCGMGKEKFIGKVRALVLASNPKAVMWTPETTSGVDNVVLDLTDDQNIEAKIAYLSNNSGKICVVLAVGRMKEGGDWPALEIAADLCPVFNSTTARIQKFGRGTRFSPETGKTSYTYYTFLPQLSAAKLDFKDYKTKSNEYFGQLALALLDSSYYAPIYWPTKHAKYSNKESVLSSVVMDTKEFKRFYREVVEIVFAGSPIKNLPDGNVRAVIGEKVKVTYEKLDEEAREILTEEIFALLQRQCRNGLRAIKQQRSSLTITDDLGLDIMEKDVIAEFFFTFTSNFCDDKTLTEIREMMSKDEKWEQWTTLHKSLDGPVLSKSKEKVSA